MNKQQKSLRKNSIGPDGGHTNGLKRFAESGLEGLKKST